MCAKSDFVFVIISIGALVNTVTYTSVSRVGLEFRVSLVFAVGVYCVS